MLYFHLGGLVTQLAIQTNRNVIFNVAEPVSEVEDLNHATGTWYSSNVTLSMMMSNLKQTEESTSR